MLKELLKAPGYFRFAALFLTSLLAIAGAKAQETKAPPCSAAATESLKSEQQLPPNPAPFGGVIKRDVRESKPCWAPRIVPPKGAPNVLLIMTDDAGFGVSSTQPLLWAVRSTFPRKQT